MYWTNLGYFYLQLSEFQLSLDSFSNAQSIDPDNIHAWFGPALIALLKQDSNVFNLFEYLLELNGDFVPEISLEYSNLFFEKYVNDSLIDVSVFTVPIFCLNKYIDRVWCLNCVSRDVGVALNLLGLLYEKVGSFDDSIACFIKCRGILDEPVVSLNLARVLLTRGDTLEALEIYQSNIKSIENNGVLESSLGMALFHSNKVPECLEWLEKGLKSSRKSNEIHQDDIAIVLSQVLFSLDTEQDIVKSREILQSIISSNPSHVKALLALGNGAVLKNDMQIAQQVASLLLIITPDVIGAVFLELVNSFMSRFFSLMVFHS